MFASEKHETKILATVLVLIAKKHPVLASVKFISPASIDTALGNRMSAVRSLEVRT